MRNTNQPQVAALAASVLASLDGTRATTAHLRSLLDEMKVMIGCADCDYRDDARALDWSHVDATTKYRTASGRLVQPADMGKPGRDGFPRYSQTVILAEVAKCDVLCATCHRLRTFHDRADDRATLRESARETIARALTRARYEREMGAGIARLQAKGINWD